LSIFTGEKRYDFMKLVFATNNNHKIEEISDLLGQSFVLKSLKDLEITDDIPEDYHTLEENALFKARYINKLTGMNVFADDTGLEIEALNGRPGVHSARFAGSEKNFEANIDKVLLLMTGTADRRARFRTVIALILNGSEYQFEGRVNGTIITERRGKHGFGYDPVFVPDGKGKTFAEMTLDEKNTISHRAIAFIKLKEFLAEKERSGNKKTK
jgi:XTP/dITP diphosphohydrolase